MPAVLAKLALPFGGVGLIVAAILGYYAYKQGWLNRLGLGGSAQGQADDSSPPLGGGGLGPGPGPGPGAGPSSARSTSTGSLAPPLASPPPTIPALQTSPTPQTAPVSGGPTPGASAAQAAAQTTYAPSAASVVAPAAPTAPPQAVVTLPPPQTGYQPYAGPGAQPTLTAYNAPFEAIPSSPGAPGGIQQAIAPFADTGPIQPVIMSTPNYIAPPEAVVTSGGLGAAAAQAAASPSGGGAGAFTQ